MTKDINKATDAQILSAIRTLENSIRELMHMSDIMAETFDTGFGPGNRLDPPAEQNGQIYHVTDHEADQMAFLISNVAGRCSVLESSFYAALCGEERQ